MPKRTPESYQRADRPRQSASALAAQKPGGLDVDGRAWADGGDVDRRGCPTIDDANRPDADGPPALELTRQRLGAIRGRADAVQSRPNTAPEVRVHCTDSRLHLRWQPERKLPHLPPVVEQSIQVSGAEDLGPSSLEARHAPTH